VGRPRPPRKIKIVWMGLQCPRAIKNIFVKADTKVGLH
jgi:hypothetical protein